MSLDIYSWIPSSEVAEYFCQNRTFVVTEKYRLIHDAPRPLEEKLEALLKLEAEASKAREKEFMNRAIEVYRLALRLMKEQPFGSSFLVKAFSNTDKLVGAIPYTIDNTSKTRALFEINKGVRLREGVEVNTKIVEEMRRVHFENMIYIADGPSDVPAFSVMNKNGGATFAIYPHNNLKLFQQVEQLRKDGRVNMYAEADYSEGTTAYMWITNKILEYADRIRMSEKTSLQHLSRLYLNISTNKH